MLADADLSKQENWWYFDGVAFPISKAIRIPYAHISHRDGKEGQDGVDTGYIFIGYKGPSWP